MQTTRYADLRAELNDFVTQPPIGKGGATLGKQHLADLHTLAIDRTRRLYVRSEEVPCDLHMWHEVRKAAKAARYCSEALTQAFGEAAEERARAWEQVTEALGEVQDTVVAEQTLIRHAATALSAGSPSRPTWPSRASSCANASSHWPPDAGCWPRRCCCRPCADPARGHPQPSQRRTVWGRFPIPFFTSYPAGR